MSGHYAFTTFAGIFRIVPHEGKWHVMFGEEEVGRYFNPQKAAEDLAMGRATVAACQDTSILGIPDDLSQWAYVSPPN